MTEVQQIVLLMTKPENVTGNASLYKEEQTLIVPSRDNIESHTDLRTEVTGDIAGSEVQDA